MDVHSELYIKQKGTIWLSAKVWTTADNKFRVQLADAIIDMSTEKHKYFIAGYQSSNMVGDS